MAHTHNARSAPAVARLYLAILLLVAVAASAAQPSRIVAIGDVHGAIDELSRLLEAAELTDVDQRRIGGSDTSTGEG